MDDRTFLDLHREDLRLRRRASRSGFPRYIGDELPGASRGPVASPKITLLHYAANYMARDGALPDQLAYCREELYQMREKIGRAAERIPGKVPVEFPNVPEWAARDAQHVRRSDVAKGYAAKFFYGHPLRRGGVKDDGPWKPAMSFESALGRLNRLNEARETLTAVLNKRKDDPEFEAWKAYAKLEETRQNMKYAAFEMALHRYL
ncbi:MAG: hypothetical protein HYS81_02035 [Candidatus Aenigmatarchaeota archaeon]|nr:MAG: hypothetical protein HYS81_02035 [Candidatus Aenigmarchaeota archaeon]